MRYLKCRTPEPDSATNMEATNMEATSMELRSSRTCLRIIVSSLIVALVRRCIISPQMSALSTSGDVSWVSFVSVGGLTSLGLGGLLWLLSKAESARADQIKGVVYHEHLDELLKLKGLLPLLVAVRGRVFSNCPKKCELSDKLAVIHEIVEEEIWRKTRENGRVVNEPFEVKYSSERAEWFLEDGVSSTRVKVENVAQADRLSTVMQASQHFVAEDTSKTTLARMIIDKSWQMAKVGVRKTERYLPVGSVVTVIGQLDESVLAREQPSHAARGSSESAGAGGADQAVSGHAPHSPAAPSAPPLPPGMPFVRPFGAGTGSQQSNGDLLLRKPIGGGPFIITPMTLEQLHESMSRVSKLYKYAALGLGTIGVALVARKLFMRLARTWSNVQTRKRLALIQQQRKQEQMRRAAVGGSGSGAAAAGTDGRLSGSDGRQGSGSAHGNEEGGDDRLAGTCVVCIDRPVHMVFTSCGHMCCCEECGVLLNRCPVCRLRGSPIKVYQP